MSVVGKSMYSLILNDEIVQAVDRLAHQRGTSRSNLINQVLADYLSLKTPEKRIGEIIHSARELLEPYSQFQIQPRQSGNLFAVKSALAYKYNPIIRYSIEISPQAGGYICIFKVSSRTQSKSLVMRLQMFYELWAQIECACQKKKPETTVKGGQFTRKFVVGRAESGNTKALGKSVAGYILLIDAVMGLFFEAKDNVGVDTYKEMLSLYEHHFEFEETILC